MTEQVPANVEAKKFMLDQLGKIFVNFMNDVIKIPGSPVQKQQACFKFDEGHMWLQNAIMTYVEPAAPPSAPVAPVAEVPPVPADEQTQDAA